MFVDYVHVLTTQAAGNAFAVVPLNTNNGPMTLESVTVYQSAVAGSPTAVTLDVNLTDGTNTRAPIAAGAIRTSAGTTVLTPDASAAEAAAANATAPADGANWRYTLDANFTGGSTPTTTGVIVTRWRV